MLSRTKLTLTVFVIFSAVLAVGNVLAADPPKTAVSYDSNTFPYLAQPVSGNVNIRSGGGTAYYECGKLKVGENVTVVGEEFGWAKIVPPNGSFSWISTKYVDIDKSNPKVGIVNGEDVRVWVGSPFYDALTSPSTQVKLSKKNIDVVELLGEEDHGYLKIAPPSGAFLYVFAKELKYIGPVGAIPDKVEPAPNVKPDINVELKNPAKVNIDPVKVEKVEKVEKIEKVNPVKTPDDIKKTEYAKKTSRSPEVMKLITLCRKIADEAENEKDKPSAQQDYTELKKAVNLIANDPKAAQAKEYARYLQNMINRYELASIADAMIKEQDEQLKQNLDDIMKKRDEAIEVVKSKNTGQYVVKGVIKPSSVFNQGKKRYLVIDDEKKIICYAVPSVSISEGTLKNYYDKKVALEGEIQKNTSGSVALVKFSAIVLQEAIEK
ncbi:MAG: hypothetical protein K9M75_05420 [Phycisphaerae bacterium]|nr:hypothetical protein [Phycisphaerae bacterium]